MELEKRLRKYRLSKDEYARIQKVLGREPEGLEWALFSAMWSEHCSYKSSRVHLKKFAFRSTRVLEGMGENAGVIDLGQGERLAFKMESHNHPSFIEPTQGAATGVGGILRDIFTMGARPVALANYLCFGRPQAERMPALVEGVVHGISGYGNCVGVPMLTGQTEFHESYDGNILVNALAVGLFREGEPLVTSGARGLGNLVVYVGAKTGRDGVHGASMASESFGADQAASMRPTVQIGDPFYEKLLIESCIEVIQSGLVVAIQDMGAAGLTSSCFEMSAKGGVGFRLDLGRVPLRDPSVGPEEILLSESQERMLLVCEPAKFGAIEAVFKRWGLDAAVLGEVTAGPEVELEWHGEPLLKIDPNLLTDNAPVYERPYDPWTPHRRTSLEPRPTAGRALDLADILTSAEGTSRRWIYQQYDQRVGAKTVRDCEEPVGVLRLPSGRALGLALGGRPHVVRLDAALGGFDAGLYPALELALKGLTPLAMTDCLNFGNPEKRETMTDFVTSVESLARAAEALDAPVISGNVSFYNESPSGSVTPTPATGVVGLREDVDSIPRSHFVSVGDEIVLWRLPAARGACDWFGREARFSGVVDPVRVARWLAQVGDLCRSDAVSCTRAVGKFGLGFALYRMCTTELGAGVDVGPWVDGPLGFSEEWFYEALLVGPSGLLSEVKKRAAVGSTEAWKIGSVQPGYLSLGKEKRELKGWHELYDNGWRRNFPGLS